MASDLIVQGPFEIPYENHSTGSSKHISKDDRDAFLSSLGDIAKKQGCYIFSLRAGRGFCPWYVGKATKSMVQECMAADKLNYYNDVLFHGYKGKPVMFFVVLPGTKNKVPVKDIDNMETFLIQSALSENLDLKNVQKTKNLPQWTIKGVIRSGKGKRTAIEKSFNSMMGL